MTPDPAASPLQNGVIVGGITYRLFARQHLGEIAFCAVSAVEQVKGYGTRLMDKLKGCVACTRERRSAAHRLLRRWAAVRLRCADCSHVSRYASKEEGLTHMITFADNNAVGYFQKQARSCAACRTFAPLFFPAHCS